MFDAAISLIGGAGFRPQRTATNFSSDPATIRLRLNPSCQLSSSLMTEDRLPPNLTAGPETSFAAIAEDRIFS